MVASGCLLSGEGLYRQLGRLRSEPAVQARAVSHLLIRVVSLD